MHKLVKSFIYAFNGLIICFENELNFKIHTIVTITVLVAGFIFSISTIEWILIISSIAMALMAELFNTAIEQLCNKVEPNIHPQIKIIKDVSAAAVLVVAIAAAIIGLIIFIPKIF